MRAIVLLLLPIALFGAAPSSDVADAVMHGDRAAVRKLIEQHADVNAPQADGATGLHWAVFRSDKEMVDLLLGAGANAKAANRDGSTPLWLASVNGDTAIVAALLKAGADANERLPLGRTPLMAAARTGNVDAMKVLLDHGADPNAKETLRGTTPLMWAADEGHAPAIQLLIEHGADIKAQSDPAERGKGPGLGKANDPRKIVALQAVAIAAGKALDLRDLQVLEAGGKLVPGKGTVPAATTKGGAAAGADGADQAQTDDGAAPVVGRRRAPVVKDGGGLTPLVYAARADDLESVKVLLAAGADINQVTAYGWSPLLVATQNRYYKLG
jgi:uncharacterized protein